MATITYIHIRSTVPETYVQVGKTPGTGGTDMTQPLRAYKKAIVPAPVQPSVQERPAPHGWEDMTCPR